MLLERAQSSSLLRWILRLSYKVLTIPASLILSANLMSSSSIPSSRSLMKILKSPPGPEITPLLPSLHVDANLAVIPVWTTLQGLITLYDQHHFDN